MTVSAESLVDLRVVSVRCNRSWGILVRRFFRAPFAKATNRLIHDAR